MNSSKKTTDRLKILYVAQDQYLGYAQVPNLAALTERHHFEMKPPILKSFLNLKKHLARSEVHAIIFECYRGVPHPAALKLTKQALFENNLPVYYYWPGEQAIEVIDRLRYQSYRRLASLVRFWLVVTFIEKMSYKLLSKGLRWYRALFPKKLINPVASEYQPKNSPELPAQTPYASEMHNDNGNHNVALEKNRSAHLEFYKQAVQEQWDQDPCGSHYVKQASPHTLAWYEEAERYRYQEYAPWMAEIMGFAKCADKKVLEVGAGLGTDLAQFAKHGAQTTDLDLSFGHLSHAKESFQLRGLLNGKFFQGDAENMPFPENTFDVVYSNGVIHHSPNTQTIVNEMYRVLKPEGHVKIMVYAEHSYHYWVRLVWYEWVRTGLYLKCSISELMSRVVEKSDHGAKPLVKVYCKKRLQNLFHQFKNCQIEQRQLTKGELPRFLHVLPIAWLEQKVGWNLIISGQKFSEDGPRE